jgi:hypothetical protein
MKKVLLHFRLVLDSLLPRIGRHITFSKRKAGIMQKALLRF